LAEFRNVLFVVCGFVQGGILFRDDIVQGQQPSFNIASRNQTRNSFIRDMYLFYTWFTGVFQRLVHFPEALGHGAGIGIDNCGTAIAHNIGHALASLRPVHHGRAVGLGLRATLAWNSADDAAGRFAAVAAAMGEPADAARVPDAYERLLRRAGIRVSLAGEGYDALRPADLALQMARPENEAMRRSNRRPVGEADLLAFAHEVLTAN